LLMDRAEINSILAGNHYGFKFESPPAAAASSSVVAGGNLNEETFGFKQFNEGCRIALNQLARDLVKMGQLETTPIKVLDSGRVLWPDLKLAKKSWMRCNVGGRALPEELFAKRTGGTRGALSEVGMPIQVEATKLSAAALEPNKEQSQKLEEDDEDVESEAYWAKSSGAKFDWLEHQHQLNWKPVGPANQYPPGLTKSQRKQFVTWNTERMRRGSIYDEELARLATGSGDPSGVGASAEATIDKLCNDVAEKFNM